MSSSRPAGLLASLLIAILLAFTIPAGALRAQMNNSWQIQQQRQHEMLRQQQMQQEQMRRQQQEQLRQQQRQQLQAQQRQQMQAQQRQQMQAQQRQTMQQQQQQVLQQQQRNRLQKQQIEQAKSAQQVGKPPPTGTPAHIANKPTGPMVFSNGVARLTRPLTPAEISRGFTGKVTPNGRALIKFQGRIFAVPASRVSGLTAKLAAQQRQTRWTAQQRGSVNEKVKALAAATTAPPPPIPKSVLNDRPSSGGGGNAGGPCDPKKSLTCNFNTQATKPGPVQVVKSPTVQASIDAAQAAILNANRLDYSKNFEDDLVNFNGGYTKFKGKLEKDLILIQYHDADREIGKDRTLKWWTSAAQGNAMNTVRNIQGSLGLPWGKRNAVSVARIPAGTEIEYVHGTASSQDSENFLTYYKGGGEQFRFKDFDPAWVTETRRIPSE